MGCDIYTWHDTVIVYMDASGILIKLILKEDNAEKHYGYEKYHESKHYDPDFEDPPRDSLQIMQESYGVKYFYNNNQWMCKEAGKQRMLVRLSLENIPLESVKEIYKVLNGYWRDYEDCNWDKLHRKDWSGPIRLKDLKNELLSDENDNESVGSE